MSQLPVCSVIIPSYRSAPIIRDCLSALLQQDIPQPYEIIVVDSSPDDTPALVRHYFPHVRLIHRPQQTDPALARNLGAAQARGEILAFIDSDCVAAPDWLRRLYTTLQQGYDGVGGAIANGNSDTLVSWAGYMCEFREFLPAGQPRDVVNLTLGNVAYRRSTFQAVGGFPLGCFPQEDQVFHDALSRKGARIRFDPRIVVAHVHRAERSAFLAHQRRIGQANARVIRRLELAGAWIARYPWLALLSMPALIPLRYIRTLHACWDVEQHLLLRRPALAWLCWLGICCWGWGFFEGARSGKQEPRTVPTNN
jgi:glycosyltransferase involved in cell wall biosynthesis